MSAYGAVYGNGNCGGGGDVYVHGDDTDLYHQVVVLSKPDGSCVRSQANGSGVCGGVGDHQPMAAVAYQLQTPYDGSCNGGGGGGIAGDVVGGGAVLGVQRRPHHRRSFWCRTTTLATISALLATMFCVTCAVFLYYNYIFNWTPIKTVALQVGRTDPCRAVKCSDVQRCVLDKSGGARCECAADSECEDGASEPVCGSDWRDYPSPCHVRKASCLAGRKITVMYEGPCDPCDYTTCNEPEICRVDYERRTTCACSEFCSEDFAPVCGSDGRTYTNECFLRRQECRTTPGLRIMFRNQCDQGVNPCQNFTCWEGEQCAINRRGIAECRCPDPNQCEKSVRPVCGTDGRTYQSKCHLERTNCGNRSTVNVAYYGHCDELNPCKGHICNFGANCRMRNGQSVCECPSCPEHHDPVCGTDGITYSNKCKLKYQSCKKNQIIKVSHGGACEDCSKIDCQFHSVCESDGHEAKCVCPTFKCMNASGKVCGSDDITYADLCHLQNASCATRKKIFEAYAGECGSCHDQKCNCPKTCTDTKSKEPVCGSDLITYNSECELLQQSCVKNGTHNLTILFYGDCKESSSIGLDKTLKPAGSVEINSVYTNNDVCKDIKCDFDATCEVGPDGFPRCSCIFNCTANVSPVCGSDFRIYNSSCLMKMEGCQRQQELRLRPMELCQGMEVKPCNGKKPLTNHLNGRELDCGHGPDRQDCPSGSYCHQTSRFAKCCNKSDRDVTIVTDDCQNSSHGCCPDKKTPAKGPEHLGCPLSCNCNKLGSISEECVDKKCICKSGVGGEKCDRCEPGYWGLPKIASNHHGCMPCGCSLLGSVRDDCEQMTGRCVCKPGAVGPKCNKCEDSSKILNPAGCVSTDMAMQNLTSCSQLICYYGGVCEMNNDKPSCVCRATCAEDATRTTLVCGSDGQTYSSECQLKLYACRYQKDIVVKSHTSCKDENLIPGTEGPKFTQPQDIVISKSTRHLLFSELPNISYNTSGGYEIDIIPEVQDLTGRTTSESTDREISACNPNPCQNDGECQELDSNGFLCHCSAMYSGVVCSIPEETKEHKAAAFNGHSYVQLKKLKAYHRFSLEMEFKSFSDDGILLYDQQQSDGSGDFISIAIVNKFVEFKYNLGNGAVVLTSLHPITIGTLHKIVAKRYQRDGLLQFENYDAVRSVSMGSLRSLDLNDNAYVGYVPIAHKKIFENIGVKSGLIGCIHRIKIGRYSVNLLGFEDSDLVTNSEGVTECQKNCTNGTCGCFGSDCYDDMACSSEPCSFGSTCESLPGGRYTCFCLPGLSGINCDKFENGLAEYFSPEFDGNHSFLSIPLTEDLRRSTQLEIWFGTTSDVGLLLYSGQSYSGQGDFISVYLSNGHVKLTYDLGNGKTNITTDEKIVFLPEWNLLKIKRFDNQASVQLNGGNVTASRSSSPLVELNLELPLYVGGVPPEVTLNPEPIGPFSGIIQRIILNEKACNLSSGFSRDVSRYRGAPCGYTPCLNGGTCFPVLSRFLCHCGPQHSGPLCEDTHES
ncbi:Concanavalin A-like lectin/glucanase domain,EGF-like, conserved site,Laminin G domain,Follistatin-like, N- [Cinara cedri]|uniref:Concanavalin A-like lectin/glucanase domain,EGF-like, conserved site,Laminin G domain,Follistatin-like, N n=1 Tax=Cinara cedri TaxID=506608 RepID=A0A5E4MKB5_9HEMI|nr:Concanavalin A-like lectin/glucanase domain,EGF-like, conserved site,Laminin G domain,Follistatin-like, N- [Cinara cedri]